MIVALHNFRFQKRYFLIAAGLLLAEVLIALFVHDAIIRPYVGDFLATILLYCLIRSGIVSAPWQALVAALFVSYLIEWLQFFHLLTHLGWQHSRWAALLLGNHFAWADLLAYTGGAALVLALGQRRRLVRNPSG